MTAEETRLRVRVTPRSARNEAVRYDEGVLYVRVTAPPVEGAANRAVTELVARLLAIPRSHVTVRSGTSGRDKLLSVEGVAETDMITRIRASLGADDR